MAKKTIKIKKSDLVKIINEERRRFKASPSNKAIEEFKSIRERTLALLEAAEAGSIDTSELILVNEALQKVAFVLGGE